MRLRSLALAFLAPALLANSAAPQAVEEWLGENALEIVTDDPAVSGEDIAAAAALLDGASLIGAGEATHGTREFFRLKDRLLRELVRNHGLRGFAIEANYADAEAINAYIQGGPGDAEGLLAGLGFWTWDTEEVADLVRWMREFNQGRDDKISFYGFDIQYAPSNIELALGYLDSVGVDTGGWRGTLNGYLGQAVDIRSGYRATNAFTRDTLLMHRQTTEQVFEYFERHEEALVAGSGKARYLQAKGAALAAAWYFMMQSRPEDWRFMGFRREYDVRDRAMADLARLALEREGPGGRVFLWAHNAHVSRSRHRDNRMTMGRYLTDDVGADYVSIGFGFDSGSFQAFPPANPERPDEARTLTRMTLPPAPGNYAGAVLRLGPAPIWIADLRELEPGTAAHGWFWQPRPWRWTGALYSDALEAKHEPIAIAQSHDVLIFVEKTSRARPLPNTIRRLGLEPDW